MSWDAFDDYDDDDLEELYAPGPGDDPAVRRLEPELISLFEANPGQVFYENQISVMFEDRFFHWVTARALKDLRESGKIGSELQELSPKVPLRFIFIVAIATGRDAPLRLENWYASFLIKHSPVPWAYRENY